MISVIIPTRDRRKDLENCLAGLEKQTIATYVSEVIVIDDHSTMTYEGVVREFATRNSIRATWMRNTRSGAASARNLGAAHATESILGFLDDDAVPEAGWAEEIVRKLGGKEAAAITGSIRSLDGDCLFSRARQLRYDRRQLELKDGDAVEFLAGGNCAVRKERFESVDGFDEYFEMMHDQDLALRLLKSGEKCLYSEVMTIEHRHFKSFNLSITQTIRSARWRRALEGRHSTVPRLSWRKQRQSWRSLWALSKGQSKDAAIVAILLEALHWAAYQFRNPRRDVVNDPVGNVGESRSNL